MIELLTADLSKFGNIEIDKSIKLLKAYREQGADFLSDGLTLNFNSNSGYVFLSDSDYNVAMLNDKKLEQWFSCYYCGHEGFKENIKHEPQDQDCKDFMKDFEVEQ